MNGGRDGWRARHAPRRTDGKETRRWLVAGVGVWLALALLHTVAVGFGRTAAGLPFHASWSQAVHSFVAVLIGGALSPLVIVALRSLRSRPRHAIGVLLAYVLIGAGYWVSWSVLRVAYTRALAPSTVDDLAIVDHLLRALVFTALAALILYAAMVFLFEVVWYRGAVRERELESARLQAQLDEVRSAALRARVDPTFIRSAFASAAAIMHQDVQGARKVLADLSELLRVSLDRNGSEAVPLRRELELARRVIAVHQARHDDRISVDFRVEDAPYAASVRPLVLQPLLNEAFQWISGSSRQDGRITVAARPFGHQLLFIVKVSYAEPSGAGAPQREAANRLQSRLRKLYGDQATVIVLTSAQHGVEMRLRLRPHGPP